MKRALSILVAGLILLTSLTGCTTLKKTDNGEYDKGAIIQMYLSHELYNFDPQQTLTDDSMLKVFSLIYEGLTTLDENGKYKNALMKSYEIENDQDGEFSILINLKNSRWSDARTVQAADFTYAWKRILDPDASYEAASLLYDIKNAYDIKIGDATIDDLGATAVDTYTLRIEFEHKIDLDEFFTKMTSIALVPLREDVVSHYGEEHWSAKSTTIVTNGPFVPKSITYGSLLRLDRNAYYYTNPEKDEIPDKFVIPYKLMNTYSIGTSEDMLEAFKSGEVFYDGDIALASRNEYTKNAVVTDIMSTHSYMFNLNNDLFADPNVRVALSMALDRNEIADIIVFAKPATGFIPFKAFDVKNKSQFRKVGGDIISTSADIEGAKSLLKEAGVSGGSFSITVRDDEVDIAVAEYVKSVWEQLGFDVSVETLAYSRVASESGVLNDDFQTAYYNGDFDVIAYDMTMISPYVFQSLAQFAVAFSGNGVDMKSENYDLYGHVSGYNSEEYNSLIEKANLETDNTKKYEILHEAENLLMKDMPVIPLAFLQDAYISNNKVLSGIKTNYYGARDLKGMKMKNYMDYKADFEEEE